MSYTEKKRHSFGVQKRFSPSTTSKLKNSMFSTPKPQEEFFKPEDTVYTYTSDQGIEDGILFKLGDMKQFKDCPVNIVTTNLMNKGYMKEHPNGNIDLNIPNLMDLTFAICVKLQKSPPDTFYDLTVELPSGDKQKIFLAENETGKFTAMLPEDY